MILVLFSSVVLADTYINNSQINVETLCDENGLNCSDVSSGFGEFSSLGTTLSPKNSAINSLVLENNLNAYTSTTIKNNNDAGNAAGSILELKGSGPDYTNNAYFGKYGSNFWIPLFADNAVLMTDKDLILGTATATNDINFMVGDSYSSPVVIANMDTSGLNLASGKDVCISGGNCLSSVGAGLWSSTVHGLEPSSVQSHIYLGPQDYMYTPVSDVGIYLDGDGYSQLFETRSSDMTEGLLLHNMGSGDSGIISTNYGSYGSNFASNSLYVFADKPGDKLKFRTNGSDVMQIDEFGHVKVGQGSTPDSFGDPLFAIGPGGYEQSMFSVTGTSNYMNIVNFRDQDGENIFLATGSMANNDLRIGVGDLDGSYGAPALFVEQNSNSIQLIGDLESSDSISVASGEDVCIAGGNCLSSVTGTTLWNDVAGNATFTSGKVGIGTTTPSAPLHVQSNQLNSVVARFATDGDDQGAEIYASDDNDLFSFYGYDTASGDYRNSIFGHKDDPSKGIEVNGDTGSVGIGVEVSSHKLDITGGDVSILTDKVDDPMNVASDPSIVGMFFDTVSNIATIFGDQVIIGRADSGTKFGIGGFSSSDRFYVNGTSLFEDDVSVEGTVSIDGLLHLEPRDIVIACSPSNEGTIYFDDSLNAPCYCSGTDWLLFDGVTVC